MYRSSTGVTLVNRATLTGRMLVVLSVLALLSLLSLLGLVGGGLGHAHWASAPTGRWMAPGPVTTPPPLLAGFFLVPSAASAHPETLGHQQATSRPSRAVSLLAHQIAPDGSFLLRTQGVVVPLPDGTPIIRDVSGSPLPVPFQP